MPLDVPDRLAPHEPGRTPDLGARYRSLFEIGRGGMGTIEVALERAAGGFERIVALKRMHPVPVRDRRLGEMFLREARLAVWLTHTNVVHAFDFGELQLSNMKVFETGQSREERKEKTLFFLIPYAGRQLSMYGVHSWVTVTGGKCPFVQSDTLRSL